MTVTPPTTLDLAPAKPNRTSRSGGLRRAPGARVTASHVITQSKASGSKAAGYARPSFTRLDTSVLGRWWWTVDRMQLGAVALLLLIGTILIMAAGPPAAGRIDAPTFHFVERQFLFLPVAVLILFGTSLLSPLWIRRLAVMLFVLFFALTALTLGIGQEIKGATRWINLGGFSLQPSEFLKPAFAVTCAWMFAVQRCQPGVPGNLIAIALMILVASVLISQPDFGMTMVFLVVWSCQFFLSGLGLFWVVLLACIGLGGAVAAYFTLPHVTDRVDRFLNPETLDNYQILTSLKAFTQGGLLGRGPGEGRIKTALPDAHTDFIFSVAGEEFGLLFCLLLVGLFAFIAIRATVRVVREDNLFVLLACGGLITQLAVQAMVNMSSSLALIPTKGMTLPFISYGGSSLLSAALAMGMILALTRRGCASRESQL